MIVRVAARETLARRFEMVGAALFVASGTSGASMSKARTDRRSSTPAGLSTPAGALPGCARRLGVTRAWAEPALYRSVKWLPSDASTEKRTFIEACETGWWYSASVPGGRTVVAYFTDMDLLPRGRSDRNAEWNAKFSLTSLMSGVHVNAANGHAHCFAAASEHAVQSAGRRWIAVGDAEVSFDPLSGQGIMNALTSAIDVTAFIADRFEKEAAYDLFLRSSQMKYDRYLQLREAHYGRETRWPDALFWRRRRPGASGTDGFPGPDSGVRRGERAGAVGNS